VSLVVVVIVLLLLAAVLAFVSAPLRAPSEPRPEREQLEAAREAKYREIRDAELDYRTGKLSREDYEAIDGALRAEAMEILERLERGDG
jgi:hypothetical protein